jgi:hypothetical protein
LAISSFPANNHFVDFDVEQTASIFDAPIKGFGGNLRIGSNTTITGSVIISGSATIDLTVVGNTRVSGSTTNTNISPNSFFTTNNTGGGVGGSLDFGGYLVVGTADGSELALVNDENQYGNPGNWIGPALVSNDPTDSYPAIIGFQNKSTWTDGRPTFLTPVDISGSVSMTGTLTASLQEGYVWVGDSAGKTTTVATSSFGGGGAAFPFTGDAQISGSLGVTGSVSGFVNTLAISSNTASMNFNDGNFFTLQLVSGSITHLTATNIKAGQTINLLVKTDSGSAAASGSLTFSPEFKFAGGFDYTPTQITASQDLVSFVTFDTTQILAAQVKNLS